jgi:hypothetical protein
MLQIMFDQVTNTLLTSKILTHTLLRVSKFYENDSLQTT